MDFDYSSTSEVEDIEKINQGYYRFSKASESEMFQNANELYYDQNLPGPTSDPQTQLATMKGAIVLSANKELVN
jgi:hypothetical protein